MQIVMKDEYLKHFKDKDIYEWDEIIGIIEDMEQEIENLKEEISDMQDNIRENYRPIPLEELYGVSDRDFI